MLEQERRIAIKTLESVVELATDEDGQCTDEMVGQAVQMMLDSLEQK